MRLIAVATICTLFALPAHAQDKEVTTIKASGANAVGICAGALDIVGRYMNEAPQPDPKKMHILQSASRIFAEMPAYPQSEISAAANAFIRLMSQRIQNAETPQIRQSVHREIIDIANSCVGSLNSGRAQARGNAPAETMIQGGMIQGGPLAPPAATVIPTQPLPPQTYETQPFILDPIVPAQ